MNAPSEMNFEEMVRVKIEVLRREHRDLDAAIHALEQNKLGSYCGEEKSIYAYTLNIA